MLEGQQKEGNDFGSHMSEDQVSNIREEQLLQLYALHQEINSPPEGVDSAEKRWNFLEDHVLNQSLCFASGDNQLLVQSKIEVGVRNMCSRTSMDEELLFSMESALITTDSSAGPKDTLNHTIPTSTTSYRHL